MTIPKGYCRCGCGGKAPISPVSDLKRGYVKGEPMDFIYNHHSRLQKTMDPYEQVVVDESGCWMWQRAVSDTGYGRMSRGGKTVYAHRWFYEQEHGPIPEELGLDHKCHNDSDCSGGFDCPHRRCVNPAHLEPVVAAINSQRGRVARLEEEDVEAIRWAWGRLDMERRAFGRAVAPVLGISEGGLNSILEGRSWRGVEPAL